MRSRKAFTLIELMIAVAMVVLLLLGINAIFRMASDTVGLGQTVLEKSRDARSARTIMEDDFRHLVKNAPLMYIRSETHRDPKDPSRRIRRDFMAFPARGVFHRYTADDGSFASGTASLESWIWYGHLAELDDAYKRIPDGNSVPGPQGARDRLLNTFGRMQVLLKDPILLDPRQGIYAPFQGWPTPLGWNAACRDRQGVWLMQNSRYDIVGMTLDQFRAEILRAYTSGQSNWHQALVYRFAAKPTVRKDANAGLNSIDMALAAPQFLTHCRESIIEFAGDFCKQDANGAPTEVGPDGVVDYIVRVEPGNVVTRGTRWYGLPRDANGDGIITQNEVDPSVAEVMPVGAFLNDIAPDAHEVADYMNGNYTCLWLNTSPAMVRVSLMLEDPSGRMQDGQWCQYVLMAQ